MNFFKALLEKWACKHKWKVHCEVRVNWSREDSGGVHHYEQTLLCSKCGKFRKLKL